MRQATIYAASAAIVISDSSIAALGQLGSLDIPANAERIDQTGFTALRRTIMIVKGDPSKNIQDIENVEIVFKDRVGYN